MSEQKQKFSLLSLNVRGIRDKMKRSKIFAWIYNQRVNVIMLQETFLTSNVEMIVRGELNNHDCYFNHGTNHSKGVAIFIQRHKCIEVIEQLETFSFSDGRVLGIRMKYCETTYCILNVYAPTKRSEKENFYKVLLKWLKRVNRASDCLILGGDWNCVQNAHLDTRGMSYAYKRVEGFKKLQKHFHLIDIWRKMFPSKKQFTWRQLSLNIFSRLDYWLVSDLFWCYVHTADIKPLPICDHCAVTLSLNPSTSSRGYGIWKINNSLLKDEVYKRNMINVLTKFKLENIKMNPQVKWDMCKIRIKEYTIKYSKNLQKRKNEEYLKLQNEYDELSCDIDENPTEEKVKRMKEISIKLDKWITYKCQGAFVRSRQKWIEKGEKSTKYFLQSEKQNAKKKEINGIKKNGKIITSQETILEEIVDYFKILYSDKSNAVDTSEMNEYLASIQLPSLSDEEAMSCEGVLSEAECREAVFSMKNNKSPGSDGLSAEFYKCFWDNVKSLVIDSLNYGLVQEELSESQNLAIITLLYKKGDKQNLDNWRPISLLNIDYKIAATVLCKRLKRIIDKLVSFDQSGYLKQRSAIQNLRVIQDIIEYCKYGDISGIFLFLDFKKAFDNVNHKFLFQLLHKLNFKESFVKWIKVMYAKATGSVINNGWVSTNFQIERGIRQGCPLSALLFILVAEVMALKIRQNKDIRGITVHSSKSNISKEFKISQLADDTVIFLDSIKSANIALEDVKMFGHFAGPSLNMIKTNAMTVQPQTEFIKDLKWNDEPIKYLGIYLTKNKTESERLNWFSKLEKVKSILKFWKMRNLSVYGKVVILKSLIISQFVYVASVLSIPQKFVAELNKLLYNFIWNSRREKVKRSVLLNPVEKGGLGMINVLAKFKSLHLLWFINYFQCKADTPWKFMFTYWIEKICQISLILKCNCCTKDMFALCQKYKLPSFYTDCLIAWSELRFVDFMHVDDVAKQILWYNSNITFERRPIFFKEWYNKGFVSIADVIENGRFKSKDFIGRRLGSNSLLVDFLYAKLKKAIPNVWLRNIAPTGAQVVADRNVSEFEIRTLDVINFSKIKSKHLYSILNDFQKSDVTVLAFWEEKLNLPSDFDWKDVLKFKFKTLKNNKVKQYNFKLFHMILPFRNNLFKWKITSENVCPFCAKPESFIHVLLECPKVVPFWKRVIGLIQDNFNETVIFDEKLLITGIDINHDMLNVNTIVVYAQYAIYKMYMINYFQRKTYNCHSIWYTFKNELILDNPSCVISSIVKT